MTFEEWEAQVRNVRVDPRLDYPGRLLYDANAMQSEAGEAGDAVKKYIRDNADLDEALLEECGDTLFYMKRLLKSRDLTVQDAAEYLLRKLDRMEAG